MIARIFAPFYIAALAGSYITTLTTAVFSKIFKVFKEIFFPESSPTKLATPPTKPLAAIIAPATSTIPTISATNLDVKPSEKSVGITQTTLDHLQETLHKGPWPEFFDQNWISVFMEEQKTHLANPESNPEVLEKIKEASSSYNAPVSASYNSPASFHALNPYLDSDDLCKLIIFEASKTEKTYLVDSVIKNDRSKMFERERYAIHCAVIHENNCLLDLLLSIENDHYLKYKRIYAIATAITQLKPVTLKYLFKSADDDEIQRIFTPSRANEFIQLLSETLPNETTSEIKEIIAKYPKK